MPRDERALTRLLAALASGERPRAVELAALSELDAAGAAQVRESWPRVDVALRDDVVLRATELADDNVDLDFAGLAFVALGDTDASVRRRAIEALWENRDRATAGRLRDLLLADPDDAVRAFAAAALGPFVLLRELGRFDAETGDSVVDALRDRAADPDESIDVRGRAVESLGARMLPWVETLITDAYYHDDSRLRVAALRAMGASAEDRWLDFLEEQALSDDPELRYEAATAFGLVGSEDALETLDGLLRDDDIEVVVAAASALGEIGGEEAAERLRAFLSEAAPEIADTVREALEAALVMEEDDLMRRGLLDAS